MPVLFERRGHVGLVTLSRPEARNAWCAEFDESLRRIFDEMEEDDSIRCVVLTGDPAGRAFSAGADLKDPRTHTIDSAGELIKDVPRGRKFVANLLTDFPKPIVAAVNGYAIGIGCIVTFCCDLIVASDKAEWRLPQANLGIMPAYGGPVRLARWVGKGLAMRLSLGFPLEAEEALRIGLAQWLVPHDEILDRALAVADHIAAQSPLATRMVKESLNRGMDIPNVGDAALVDVYRFLALTLTEDKAEGHDAWLERRKPDFPGR